MVARLFWVPPSRGEQFFLRILLAKRPARGYADLIAAGGTDCNTFQDAAIKLGLANSEDEYKFALQEACAFMIGARLRNFFVLVITQGAPARKLWDLFKHLTCKDLSENRTLMLLGRKLLKHGSSLLEVGLPHVVDDSTELGREREMYSHVALRLNAFVDEWQPMLSGEQRALFDHVVSLAERGGEGGETALFVDGPAGTGKTLLLNVLTARLRGAGHVVLCCASSGIAADNHEGGYTAHSLFRLPLDVPEDNAYWNITNGSQRAHLIREARVVIYDEAPMAHKSLIEMVDRSMRDLMNSPEKLFGGKIVIFAGDFRQIPPVVVGARGPGQVVAASLRCSYVWERLRIFPLTQAQRTRNDGAYSEFLLAMGSGSLSVRSVGEGRDRTGVVALPHVKHVTELEALIQFVFPDDLLSDPDLCAKRALLSIHNANVRAINTDILGKIQSPEIHLYSVDTMAESEDSEEFLMGTDTLNMVTGKGVPDHHMVVKCGAVCMITRNLSFDDRLLNGTKVIIVGATSHLVHVRKPGRVEIYCIPRITFKIAVDRGSPVEMCRKQFPLQLAYAMSVNKSQGQTIERVSVDLRSDAFFHGQAYVAFGRVRDSRSICVLVDEDRVIDNVPHVKNIVYPQLLT